MSALITNTIVMRMLSALTTLVAFHVLATLDTQEMEHFAVSVTLEQYPKY